MEIQQVNLGQVAFNPKGNWNADVTYKRLNVVYYKGRSYYAKQENANQPPSMDSDFWGLMVDGGDVTNNPDEEDVTSMLDDDGKSVIKFADRTYDPDRFSGNGYKILRKNMQNVRLAVVTINVSKSPTTDGELFVTINKIETHIELSATEQNTTELTAQAIAEALTPEHEDYDVVVSGSTIKLTRKFGGDVAASTYYAAAEGMKLTVEDSVKTVRRNLITPIMISKANTIYEIRYDFDLNGGEIEVPDNCVLKFEGGSFRNGKVTGKNTLLKAVSDYYICKDITLYGNFNNRYFNVTWFGLKHDSIINNLQLNDVILKTDNSLQFDKLINSIINLQSYNLYFPKGIYYFSKETTYKVKFLNPWFGTSRDYNIFGDGKNSTIFIYNSDNGINIDIDKTEVYPNVNFRDFCIINYKNYQYDVLKKYTILDDINEFINKGCGIVKKGTYQSKIKDVSIYGFYLGLLITDQYGGIEIEDVFTNNLLYGVCVLSESNNVILKNCYFNGYDISYYLNDSFAKLEQCLTEMQLPADLSQELRCIGFYINKGNYLFEQCYTESRLVSRYVVEGILVDNNPICRIYDSRSLPDILKNKINSGDLNMFAYYIKAKCLYQNLCMSHVTVNNLDNVTQLYTTYDKIRFLKIDAIDADNIHQSTIVNNKEYKIITSIVFNINTGDGLLTNECFANGNAMCIINSKANVTDFSMEKVKDISYLNNISNTLIVSAYSNNICNFYSSLNKRGLSITTDKDYVYLNEVFQNEINTLISIKDKRIVFSNIYFDGKEDYTINNTNGLKVNFNKKLYKIITEYNQFVCGTTDERPSNVVAGFQYFDINLQIPIWWNGSKWLNATGEQV